MCLSYNSSTVPRLVGLSVIHGRAWKHPVYLSKVLAIPPCQGSGEDEDLTLVGPGQVGMRGMVLTPYW